MTRTLTLACDPAVVASILYICTSVSMIIVNKLILSTFAFNYPMVLLLHQNIMTVNSLYVAQRLGMLNYEPLDRARVIGWLPVDLFFIAMLLTGFYSLQLLSVPMQTIFKMTNNVFIAMGDTLLFGNFPSQGVIYSLAILLLAAVLAGLSDLEYNPKGYLWTFVNCFFSTSFVLYTQIASSKTKLGIWGKVYYNNVIGIPLVLVADQFMFNDLGRLANEDDEKLQSFFTLNFVCLWFLSGILGFLQSLTSLRAQQLTTPTTYSMVGSLSKIPLTFLGVVVFKTQMSWKSSFTTAMSISAGIVYSYAKAQEMVAKDEAKHLAKSPEKPAPSPPASPPSATTTSTARRAKTAPVGAVDLDDVLASKSNG